MSGFDIKDSLLRLRSTTKYNGYGNDREIIFYKANYKEGLDLLRGIEERYKEKVEGELQALARIQDQVGVITNFAGKQKRKRG